MRAHASTLTENLSENLQDMRQRSRRRDWRDGVAQHAGAWQPLVRLIGVAFVVGLLVLGVMLLLPEMRRQKNLDVEIAQLALVRDQQLQERGRAQQKLDWMRYDPAYLELHARDLLDLYKEGETILRINRERGEVIEP